MSARPGEADETARLDGALARQARFRKALENAYPFPAHLIDAVADGEIVCRCEGITAGALREAAREKDAGEMNRLKALTRIGMGRCQGRVCGHAAAELLARARGSRGRERRPAAGATAGQADPGPRERAVTERLTADVTIIGGGVAGCAAAVALRRAGITVVLLEKGMCGAGASGVNFGGVRQQGRNLAELPLARRSREIWDRLAEMLGEDVEFQATGHIKLARSDADMEELERYARDAAESWPQAPDARRQCDAGRAALARAEGGRRLALRRGRRRQSAPRRAGLSRASRAGSARKCASKRRRLRPSAAGERFETRAEALTITSRFLVNTAGIGAGTVAGWFGEEAPLGPVVPNMLVTEPLPAFVTRSVGVCGGDVYVRQVARGNVIMGGGRGWGDADLTTSRPVTDQSLAGMAKTPRSRSGPEGRVTSSGPGRASTARCRTAFP